VNNIPGPAPVTPKRRIHWHVFFTHFPISLFGAAFGFQVLHLFMAPACFELATTVMLMGAVATLLPTIWTGWSEWKSHYGGAKALIFRRKIRTAFGMAALGLPLVVWRVIVRGLIVEAPGNPVHMIYLSGNTLLIIGAILEGYYGGRLSHR
jgi:hypothetical protein